MDPTDPEPTARAPRYEVLIEPAALARSQTITRIVITCAVAAVLVYRFPYSVGAAIVLPLVFAWVGLRVASLRSRATTVRFWEDVLEVSTGDVVHRTGWEHFEDVKETAEGVVLELPRGARLVIPKAQLPADRRVLIDALPSHVRFEVVTAAPQKSAPGKTIALWLVLVGLMYVLYYAMAQR